MIHLEVPNLERAWYLLNMEFTKLDDNAFISWNTGSKEYYLPLCDVIITSKSSMAPRLFLEDLGYSSRGAKIKSLISKYLSIPDMRTWLNEIARWQHRDTPYFLPAKESDEKFPGNCLIGFSFRLTPRPHLLMLSRAVEMPHKGGADLLLMSGIAKIIREYLDLPVVLECTWMIDRVWITSRTARLLLIYRYPKKVRYQNKTFHKGMIEGWEKYFINDEKLTYSTGRKMQQFFEDKQCGQLTHNMGSEQFYLKLKEALK